MSAISVVVPMRDAEATLPALLAALMPQIAARSDAELIVVDNGSSDRSAELAGEAGARVLHEARPGASAARNAGVRAAQGELIVFLDSDCIPRPGWLDGLVQKLHSEADAGACGGRVVAAPASGLLQRHAERSGYISQEHALRDPFLPYLLTANCCYRQGVLERLGGFDEALRSGEDTELAWRMQLELGLTVAFAPEAVVEHVHRTTLAGVWRQWVRYGWGSFQLAERFPDRPGSGAARSKAALRLLGGLGHGLLALLRLPLKRSDPLDAAAPLLRCIEVAADRVGRRQARRASRAHRPA
jgi:cellulose synthase/poly-beta-1,6-N-acetylglucosamine synthase-like glycosyltransferase